MAKKIALSKGDAGVLYLISHTHTTYNRPGLAHDRVQGWKDIPLTTAGRAEARGLGKFLQDKGVSTIYSSNLKRAAQTAELIGKVLNLPVKESGDYRPWNLGNFAGDSSANVIPKLEEFLDDPSKVVPGGESFDSFKDRFLPAFEKLLKQAEGGATVALVTHSRCLEFAEGWLGGDRKKLDEDEIGHILNDAVNPGTVVEVSKKGSKFKMRLVGPKEIAKAQAQPAELCLTVVGVSKSPDGQHIYRMSTRDGRYVGRTNASRHRAVKGDVLKVQANDFRINASGDTAWSNANVLSAYKDRAYSWKYLQALAGGELVKDGAPGPAGDIPAAGDEGSSAMPSGPTLAAVHIDAPLPNISVAYAGRPLQGKKIKVVKAEPMHQLVYGVVLEPNSLDSQNDYMLPQHVEKAAHTYLKKAVRGTSSVVKLQHRRRGFKRDKPSIIPVESFIAPIDFSYDGKEMIKKGSWVLAMHVEDEQLWQDFVNGKYTGFSVGGFGVRQSMHNADVPHGYITSDANQWQPDPHDMGLVAETS
jgi:broad specificity phosphatase PhoE